MPRFHLIELDRDAYLSSTKLIEDVKTKKFALQSLAWWDKHFNWKVHGCIVLSNEKEEHLCYIFFAIDRYKEYLTIHNIFTPQNKRRVGNAQQLLSMVFSLALRQYVRRVKFSSISNALDFYETLGFIYWGITSIGDYYCDLPLPKGGLGSLKQMTQKSTRSFLLGRHEKTIIAKVDHDIGKLTLHQQATIKNDKRKLGKSYRALISPVLSIK